MSSAPIHIQKYSGATQEESLRLFAQDAARAAAVGYRPADQTWDGTSLLVTYQYVGIRWMERQARQGSESAGGTSSDSPLLRPGGVSQLLTIVVIGAIFLLVILMLDRGMGGGTISEISRTPLPVPAVQSGARAD